MRLCVLAAGTKNLKDHRNLLLERRAIVARHSMLPARTPDTNYASAFATLDFPLSTPQCSESVKRSWPSLFILAMLDAHWRPGSVRPVESGLRAVKSRKVNKRVEL